jgi:hypothetical protein
MEPSMLDDGELSRLVKGSEDPSSDPSQPRWEHGRVGADQNDRQVWVSEAGIVLSEISAKVSFHGEARIPHNIGESRSEIGIFRTLLDSEKTEATISSSCSRTKRQNACFAVLRDYGSLAFETGAAAAGC